MLLNIKNITIGYPSKKGDICIASAINISIDVPKLICLLGKNGIGKSTLLRTISKVQPVLKGEIIIDDKNLVAYNSVALSKKISIVLTERIPPNNLTVYELIALGRQVYTNWIGKLDKKDKLAIDNAIDLVKINTLKNSKVDELSDGQYQKVMIARALAQDTSIILLDEPTAHLDINNKVEIFHLLKKLANEKLIIISSHELQLSVQTADDLWLMSDDNFTCGSKNELIKNNELQRMLKTNLVTFDKKTNQFLFH